MNFNKITSAFLVSLLLVGCSNSTTTTDNTATSNDTTTASSETSSSEDAVVTADTEVTEDNFRNFPVSDESEFSVDDWEDGVVIQSCTSEDKVIVVPETINGKTVLAIGERGLTALDAEAIVLQDTVIHISDSGIVNNENMKYIHLGDSLETINHFGLGMNGSLLKVEFPDSVKSIGMGILTYDHSLELVIIPETVEDVDSYFLENQFTNDM